MQDRLITRKSSVLLALGLGALTSVAAGCSGTLAFSDTSSIAVAGTPPPPPPPPPPAAPPPPPPPEKPKRVEVTQDQIVIREKIQYETGKATIKPESFDLLNEIVGVFKDNQQITKVSIEGHTDSEGGDKYNQKLSDQRAASVVTYLTEKGIDPARITSKGWGEAKPIGDNKTEEGKEQNRRVEFIIVEQDTVKKTFEIDPKTGEKKEVVDKKAKKKAEEAKKAEEKKAEEAKAAEKAAEKADAKAEKKKADEEAKAEKKKADEAKAAEKAAAKAEKKKADDEKKAADKAEKEKAAAEKAEKKAAEKAEKAEKKAEEKKEEEKK